MVGSLTQPFACFWHPDLNFRAEGEEEGLPSAIIVLANSEWVSGENAKNLPIKTFKKNNVRNT